jgi:hypothetical protein
VFNVPQATALQCAEGTMSDSTDVLEALNAMDGFLVAMNDAGSAAEIVMLVERYLAGWPAERVRRLQRVDAGWAPFDERQRPAPVDCAADVRRIHANLHAHCRALKAGGIALSPEILELDLFFFFADLALGEIEASGFARGSPRACAPAEHAAAGGA